MRIVPSLLLSISLLSAGALSVQAADGRWFGFGSTSKSAVKTTNVSNTASSGMFSGVTNGTKSLVSGTKNMLTPKKKPVVRKSGVTSTHPVKKTERPKPGFFSSLVSPEPPPPPRTIKEWMALKQIHP